MTYNPIIHHRRSIRLKGYDYSQVGIYFVTLCTQNRDCLFGKIIDRHVKLNTLGWVVDTVWNMIDQKYSHVEVNHVIVMPDHLHGIVIISDNYQVNEQTGDKISAQPTLGQIIAWFKYQSTKQVNQIRQTIGKKIWQRNYYERIIRNEKEYNNVIKYINNNPLYWNNNTHR